MGCIRKWGAFGLIGSGANGYRSYAGYSHMGTIWFEAIKAASAKGLITPPVSVAVQPE
jgi:hypothetical protein